MKIKITAILLCIISMQMTLAQNLVSQWVKFAGGESFDLATGMATDNEGNLYVCGNYRDTLDAGSKKLASKGNYDIFVVKYDKDGKLLWAKSFGGKKKDEAHSIKTDGEQNVYLCGKYSGEAEFGSKSISTEAFSASYIAKLDNTGNTQWLKSIKSKTKGDRTILALDKDDNLFYAGTFYKTIELDAIEFKAESAADIFITTIDKEGKFTKAITIKGFGNEKIKALAFGEDGNLYISGAYDKIINFGNQQFEAVGKTDAFIAKLSGLEVKWAKSMGGSYTDYANNISTSANGEIIISGSFTDEAFFGNTSLLSNGGLDAFVCVIEDNKGETLYARSFGGAANEYVNSLLINPSGSFYINGSYRGKIETTKGEIESTDKGKDIYIAKYGADGTFLWAESFGGSKPDFAVELVRDTENYLYEAGTYSKNLKIGTEKGTTIGNANDFFVNKFYDCDEAKKVSLGDDRGLCEGSLLVATPGFKSYKWDTGEENDTIFVQNTGTYSVAVVDEYGCQSSDTVEIEMYNLPELELGSDILAGNNQSVEIDPEGEFATYLWQDNSTGETFTIPPTNEDVTIKVKLTVTNEHACEASDSLWVVQKEEFNKYDQSVIDGDNANYKVFPNPTTGIFRVMALEKGMLQAIEVYDVGGNLIERYEDITSSPIKINIGDKQKGTYMVIVYEATKAFQYKVVLE